MKRFLTRVGIFAALLGLGLAMRPVPAPVPAGIRGADGFKKQLHFVYMPGVEAQQSIGPSGPPAPGGTTFTGGTVANDTTFSSDVTVGGQVFAPQTAGCTAGTVSYSFTGDTDTGLQNTAANTLTFCVNATAPFSVGTSGANWPIGYAAVFGTVGTDATIYMNQNQTPDALSIAVGNQSNSVLLIERADQGFDFAHAAATDPTLFIHSHNQSTSEWTSVSHTGTYGQIATGTGDLFLNPGGSALTRLGNNGVLIFGGAIGNASTNNGFQWNTAQTPDTAMMFTGSTGNSWVIAEMADAAFDFAHAAATDPTLFIHSHNQNTTQWVGLTHDGTNGVLSLGTGDLKLAQSGTILAKDGTVGDVAYGFSTDGDDTGAWLNGTGNYVISAANTAIAQFNSAALRIKSSTQVNWSSGDPSTTTSDTGLARNAAGVIRATDGSAAIRGFLGGGASVASASALPVPTGNVFHVTGTTNIDSITSTNFASGACITMIFDGVLTVGDANNLKLTAAFVSTADDTLNLCYDGTNWYETARSVN